MTISLNFSQLVSFSLACLVMACSSSTSVAPPGGTSGQGGNQGGQSAGGNAQAGTNTAGGSSQGGASTQGGASGQSSAGGSSAGSSGAAGLGGYDPSGVCPQACARLKTCNAEVDVEACSAQCQKEILGEGYLIPEMANDYFTLVRDISEENVCGFLVNETHWLDKWKPFAKPENKFETLKEQDVFQPCVEAMTKCDGETPVPTHESFCLFSFYKYNVSRREEIKPCFASKCLDLNYCISQHQTGLWQPWLAGVPKPTE